MSAVEPIKIQIYDDELQGQWVRASHADILACGMQDLISSENTRMTRDWVYLDATQLQESEAAQFLANLRMKHPHRPMDFQRTKSGVSSIRKMAHYCKGMLNFTFTKDRIIAFDNHLWRIENLIERGRGKVVLKRLQEVA